MTDYSNSLHLKPGHVYRYKDIRNGYTLDFIFLVIDLKSPQVYQIRCLIDNSNDSVDWAGEVLTTGMSPGDRVVIKELNEKQVFNLLGELL